MADEPYAGYVPVELKIEIMRSISTEDLISILIQDIYESNSDVYIDFINIMEGKDISILIAPSTEDKLLLLQTIISYVSIYTEFTEEEIVLLTEKLVGRYNTNNIGHCKSDYYTTKINITNDNKLARFISCSYWLDMDRLLVYLYNKYNPEG